MLTAIFKDSPAMTSTALSKLTGLASTTKSSTQDSYTALKAVIERSENEVEDLVAFLEAKCVAAIPCLTTGS